MKFSAPLVLLSLALGLSAEPLAKRDGDLSVFLGIFSSIQDQTDVLDSAIKTYTGGDGTDVQAASAKLVSIIGDGVAAANGQDVLSFGDGVSLTDPVLALVDHINTCITDIIAKKDAFVESCLGPTILGSLQEQYSGSNDLAEAVSAKVPALLQDIAKQLAGQVSSAIETGVTAYTGVEGCTTTSAPPTDTATATDTAPPTDTATATDTAPPTDTASDTATATDTAPPTDTASETATATDTSYPVTSSELPPSSDTGCSTDASGYSSSKALPSQSAYPNSTVVTYSEGAEPTTYPGSYPSNTYPAGGEPNTYPGNTQPTTNPAGGLPNTYSGGAQPTTAGVPTHAGSSEPSTVTSEPTVVTAAATMNRLSVPAGALALFVVFIM